MKQLREYVKKYFEFLNQYGYFIKEKEDCDEVELVGNNNCITIGFGTYVPYDDKEQQKNILKEYGVDATNEDEWVPVEVATKMYSDSMATYENRVANWATQNNLSLTQQEFDALVIQAYNGFYATMATAYMDYTKTDEEVVQSVLDVYRGLKNWDKYAKGWENRVRATVDVLRKGDYEKKY